MKTQDYLFLLVILILLTKRNFRLSVFLGLLTFLISIPLFTKWIFFTAERLTWYGAGFILLGILQLITFKKTIFSLLTRTKKMISKIARYGKIINILFFVIITINFTSVLLPNSSKYFSADYWKRFEMLKYTYDNSQYMQKNPKAGWIPDEYLFAYAGGAFLKGVNPTYIAAGSAPLGKYLISLSILLFKNENTIMVFSAVLTLFFLYLLGKQIFQNTTLALIAPTLLSTETFFKNQMIYVPLLDLIQLPFLLSGFYFFNQGMNSYGKRKIFPFILTSISLGGFIAVKFFVTGIIIVAAYYLLIFLRKDKISFIFLTLALPFSLMVLMASYFKIFLEGYTLKQFFGIQKWILLYHQSKLILPFTVWPLIFLNQWHVWYGNKPIINDAQWQITWPILQSATLLTYLFYLLKKIIRNSKIEILLIWSFLYIIFSSFGEISSRYLVIYFPVLYIITVYLIKELFNKFQRI